MQHEFKPGPQKPEYEPTSLEQAIGYFIEECGEAAQAVGKCIRYGMGSYNPDLPPAARVSNAAMLRNEMRDVEEAIFRVRKFMDSEDL